MVEHRIADPVVAGSIPAAPSIRHGVVGNISACHADARGSIPRAGETCSISLVVRTPRCGRGNPGSNPGDRISYGNAKPHLFLFLSLLTSLGVGVHAARRSFC